MFKCEMFSNVVKGSCGCMRSTNLAAKNLLVLSDLSNSYAAAIRGLVVAQSSA